MALLLLRTKHRVNAILDVKFKELKCEITKLSVKLNVFFTTFPRLLANLPDCIPSCRLNIIFKPFYNHRNVLKPLIAIHPNKHVIKSFVIEFSLFCLNFKLKVLLISSVSRHSALMNGYSPGMSAPETPYDSHFTFPNH